MTENGKREIDEKEADRDGGSDFTTRKKVTGERFSRKGSVRGNLG